MVKKNIHWILYFSWTDHSMTRTCWTIWNHFNTRKKKLTQFKCDLVMVFKNIENWCLAVIDFFLNILNESNEFQAHEFFWYIKKICCNSILYQIMYHVRVAEFKLSSTNLSKLSTVKSALYRILLASM